jgi:hypothetical protein
MGSRERNIIIGLLLTVQAQNLTKKFQKTIWTGGMTQKPWILRPNGVILKG